MAVIALAAGASDPAVAAWLAVGTAGLAAVVVAMVWNVNVRQIRLAELLARRQFLVTSETRAAGRDAAEDSGAEIEANRNASRAKPAVRGKSVPPEVIEGPDEVIAGSKPATVSSRQARTRWCRGRWAEARSRMRPTRPIPHDLLLIADQPGDLTIIARVREGLTERRATKLVTAVPEATLASPPFTLRLFLHGWGLVVVAVLIIGFAGSLDALGNFTSSDFIALAVPLAALLGVIAVARGASEPGGRPGHGAGSASGTASSRARLPLQVPPSPDPTVAPASRGRHPDRPGHQRPHLAHPFVF